ncbi:ABC transporter ATP-binding protein [Rathayibacter toxicus]|uniref:ABC-type quaternary amine transporter n=1 Tax=Rathayibacter toxicus TaxID=145458 RepID=A0A0U1PVP9_9MICO|nr:ABC transporter ATP-binding protein [Rathayibacter toxicus]ALS57845.1 spermidine/putrescine ABC transporter ATP-binding protein [Rathayibacter toxicus]KKM46958.1 spermidine/putrescine ABC transporter ATP-binding protein [Rathayibacter toxicus]PPG20484.1 ABC transporter ATP-binding protein [Rathayibacter toxicus]PPG45586.1 ABC transporter ATP-binding protein [Rathayibacter toxicus]PPH22686.1 ABC transporter ATP-binding protein [Rathayibacter toxicus]
MTSPSTPALTTTGARVCFRDVARHYGAVRALDGVSLDVAPGEFIALLGPSGCGKTTALRALSGLERIDSGHILVDGHDIADVPVSRRDMGMVFQSYSLFPHLSARQNVEFGLRTRGVAARERRFAAQQALEVIGLGTEGERYAHQLSGGQQQRVALARALVTRPKVLLLDEPLSALDAKVRVQLRDEIARLQSEIGITTFFVTHDQEEALAVADRVAVMNAGRIEQLGSPEELYTRPATPFVAHFIGLSNVLPGVVAQGSVTVLGVRVPLIEPGTADGPVSVFLRPEDLELVSAEATEALPVVVVASSFLGPLRRSTVRTEQGDQLMVQHSAGHRLEVGERIGMFLLRRPVAVRSVATETAQQHAGSPAAVGVC